MSIPSSYSAGSIGGGTSGTGDVKWKFQGLERSKTADNLQTKITYQSTKETITQKFDTDLTWKPGAVDSYYGTLLSVNIQQDNAQFWSATLNYNKVLNDGSEVPASALGPQHTALDISMYSVPIEKHPNYDYRWNHFLFVSEAVITRTTVGSTESVTYNNWQRYLSTSFYPAFSATVLSTYGTYAALTAAQGDNWISKPFFKMDENMAQTITDAVGGGSFDSSLDALWAKDMNEKPRQPRHWYTHNIQTFAIVDDKSFTYQTIIPAWKPGVEYFDLPTYQITESGRYKSKTGCNWALKKGGVIAYPLMGDFGIQRYIHPNNLTCALKDLKGYWLCEGGNIEFDGKYYNATCKYTWDILDEGWDQDIYLFYNSRKYYQDQSKLNPNSIMGNETLSTTVWDRNQWEQ